MVIGRIIVSNHVGLLALLLLLLVALEAFDRWLDQRTKTPSIGMTIQKVASDDPHKSDHAGGGDATSELVRLERSILHETSVAAMPPRGLVRRMSPVSSGSVFFTPVFSGSISFTRMSPAHMQNLPAPSRDTMAR